MDTIQKAKQNWTKIVRKYMQPHLGKSYYQIANSLIPYLISWVVAYYAYQYSVVLCLMVALVAQVFLLRIFIIMHDCGHGSFFKSKKKNDFWGFLCGVLSFSPYLQWSRAHKYHHKHSGNLDYRGIGDVDVLTVEEYEKLTPFKKLKYKLIRSPFVFITLGAFYVFIFQHRFTAKDGDFREKMGVYLTNLCILASGLIISYFFSFGFYIIYQLAVVVFSAMSGIFLFYVQHQYENVYWQRSDKWDHLEASLKGSSYFKLPKIFQWASGNIGFHHIHHLCSSIPNYNLEKAYKENPLFQEEAMELGLRDSIKCLFLHLYDMKERKMISFSEYRRRQRLNPTRI